MTSCPRSGIALIAALLTLASLTTLALGTTLLLGFDLKLVENRQELALARAQARSRLTLVLLELEEEASSGELPERVPGVPGVVEYLRDGTSAVVTVEGGQGSGSYLSGARIELKEVGGEWRVHIVEQR